MSEVIKEGWCTKLGDKFKTWKKRWFVLEGNTLKYYSDNSNNKVIKGEIVLKPEYEIGKYPQCKKQPAFFINTFQRIYQIVPPNVSETEDWINTLNRVKSGKTQDKVSLSDFEVIKTLGRGAYGKVTLSKYKPTGQLYALKSLDKKSLQENELIERTKRERDTLMKIHHPFLVSAHYAFQTETHIFLAQEFLPGGDMFTYVCNLQNDSIGEKSVRYYIAMLLLGIGELHSHGIIHRDLKLDNILFDENGYIKITDFGLVKFEIKKGRTTDTFCGTPEYMAPEIINEQPYGRSVDWWSLGILAYKLIFGLFPFYHTNGNEMYRSIVEDDLVLPDNESVSEDAKDFLFKILEKDPQTRLGSSEDDYKEIQRHPWFNNFPWEPLLQRSIKMDYVPKIDLDNPTANFEREFTEQDPGVTPMEPNEITVTTQTMLAGFTQVNEENF